MLANSVKRKLEEAEALEEVRCPTLLSMSLMKLSGPRVDDDLGLQRRVLISNMIRRIHDDVRQEGVVHTHFFLCGPLASAPAQQEGSSCPPPPSSASFPIVSSASDSCLTPTSLLEDDLPMFFTSSALPHLLHPTHSSSSALEDMEELCPSPLPGVHSDIVMKEEGRGFHQKRPPPAGTPGGSPSSLSAFVTDFTLDDVPFTDATSRAGMLPAKMADSVVSSHNHTFKTDLTELDHIMEVLVGS